MGTSSRGRCGLWDPGKGEFDTEAGPPTTGSKLPSGRRDPRLLWPLDQQPHSDVHPEESPIVPWPRLPFLA